MKQNEITALKKLEWGKCVNTPYKCVNTRVK